MTLFEEMGKQISLGNGENIVIPVGNRRFIQFNLTKEEVIDLFSHTKIQ
jgi:hypothetical protein